MPKQIIAADALEWLPKNRRIGGLVLSPPDADEIGADLITWKDWLMRATTMCFDATTGPIVFYTTDRRYNGRLVSKASIVYEVESRLGINTAWHKIVLRRGPEKTDLHRPTYTHMIALGERPGPTTADVIYRGDMLYPNAMGFHAAKVALDWISRYTDTVIDPFCGRGTIPAIADAMGMNAIGVDIDPDQCAYARKLKVSADVLDMRTRAV